MRWNQCLAPSTNGQSMSRPRDANYQKSQIYGSARSRIHGVSLVLPDSPKTYRDAADWRRIDSRRFRRVNKITFFVSQFLLNAVWCIKRGLLGCCNPTSAGRHSQNAYGRRQSEVHSRLAPRELHDSEGSELSGRSGASSDRGRLEGAYFRTHPARS